MAISIKAARVNAGLTQVELAELLKKSKSTIINYESYSTNVPINVALEMAKLFGLSVNEIKWSED